MDQDGVDNVSTVCFALPKPETRHTAQNDLTCVLRKLSTTNENARSRQISPKTSFADYSAEELPDLALIIRTLLGMCRKPRQSEKLSSSPLFTKFTPSVEAQQTPGDASDNHEASTSCKIQTIAAIDKRSVLLNSIARLWLSLAQITN